MSSVLYEIQPPTHGISKGPLQGSTILDAEYVSHFTPYQKVVYLTTQVILTTYINRFFSDTDVSQVYLSELLNEFHKLPYSEYMPGRYQMAYETLKKLFHVSDSYGKISTSEVLSIYMDDELNDISEVKLYKTFLIPVLYVLYNAKNDELVLDNDVDDGVVYEPIMTIPEFTIECNLDGSTDKLVARMRTISEFSTYVSEHPDINNYLFKYLSGFNWSGKNVTQLIGLLSKFTINHDLCNYATIPDVCYDIVTHSNFTADVTVDNRTCLDFINFIKYLCERWQLAIDDTSVLAQVLARCNYNSDVLSYLAKDANMITASEMEAFNKSDFAKYVKHKVAVEASDTTDELSEDEDPSVTDSTTPEGDPMTDTDVPAIGDTQDDVQDDASSQDTELEKLDRSLPESPDGIIMELLDPTKETMADHLFRAEFQMRVNNLLQNTRSSKCSKYTMYLLTQWATKWLYVCSTASLRSFLENISFPIMSEKIN